ncbi:hypothetical protein EGT67_00320 [Prescottella agglutinans]|uniref:DUF2231 domain-containing protein n=1 Tax=Prescottella agglutinans TaxID=1644129 RepID=A0A3S3ZY77_9NOCA|nr:DUF2231 domain-containing protein [Prescottella agglutinans]RVW10961.1 hypothetical protein EGT67_00320 [Prescottella agglutinans]
MGPTTFNGMPIHPLFVHFVAVLVPISALLVLLSVCWPAARRRIGVLAPVIALITLILVPLTTHAGEWLEERTPGDPLVRIHAELGDQLIFWSAGVFLVSLVWWAVHDPRVRAWRESRRGPSRGRTPRAVVIALAVVAIAASVGSVVQVYRIGDSGAAAVWSGSGAGDEESADVTR